MKFATRLYAAKVENLTGASEYVEECADGWGLSPKKKFGLLVALEEAFVNVCGYAYPEGGGEVELTCEGDADSFALEIADKGLPFDVLSLPDPDTTLGIDEREIGGLGVHLIRTLSDSVGYRRENGSNILRMVFTRG
jgi:anti-sigma regulatory factor (Ser/Thr protein kinase)